MVERLCRQTFIKAEGTLRLEDYLEHDLNLVWLSNAFVLQFFNLNFIINIVDVYQKV